VEKAPIPSRIITGKGHRAVVQLSISGGKKTRKGEKNMKKKENPRHPHSATFRKGARNFSSLLGGASLVKGY